MVSSSTLVLFFFLLYTVLRLVQSWKCTRSLSCDPSTLCVLELQMPTALVALSANVSAMKVIVAMNFVRTNFRVSGFVAQILDLCQ